MNALTAWLGGGGLFSKSSEVTYSSSPASWLVDWVRGGGKTTSGARVNPASAMQFPAVYACVNVRGQDVGRLDCFLMRRIPETEQGGGGAKSADDHWAYHLILSAPNPRMTPMEFKFMMQVHKDLRGNAYAFKQRNGRGGVIALWPLPSQHVTVLEAEGGELFYKVSIPNREEVTVPAEDIVHLRGLTLDGKVGLSPIAYHRETIGLGIAALEYGASFFGNSAQPNGAIKLPGIVDKDTAKALRESWNQKYRGAKNANQLAFFDGGMEWVKTGMDNTDAQYLETRRFQNNEIWRLYRMPPHKVADLDKATFSNIEHQGLEYVTDCLDPELINWCQTLARDLLTEEERKTMFFLFDRDPLMRGGFKETLEALAIARNWAIYNADECRAKLGENPIKDGTGKIYLEPTNMVPAGTPLAERNPGKPAGGTGGDPAATGDPKKRLANAEALFAHAQRYLQDARHAIAAQTQE